MHKHHQQAGFSLIEMIMVIVLLGILVAGSSTLLSTSFNSFFTGKNIINANWRGGVAMERLTRELRVARSNTDIARANVDSISIVDIEGTSITYQVVNNELQRNNQTIADGVSNINFRYFTGDATLAELTAVPLSQTLRESVRYVVITLNMAYNNITFPITAAVFLWNLK